MMRQAVPGLFGALAPQPPEVQAPAVAPGLFSAQEDGHSATIRQAQNDLQSFFADPVKAMTYTTLNGTAGQGPDAAQRSLAGLSGSFDHRGGFSDNSGLSDVASRATSLGGFLSEALGNVAAIANPTPLGWAGLGFGIANNRSTLGVKGLFDAIAESLGFGDGGGWDRGGIGGYGTSGRGAFDPGVAGMPGGVTGRGSDGGGYGSDPTGGTGNTGGPGHSDGNW
ncbi:hypothetical protein ABAZ39_07215 [Azospirillum argentinense]|uniref:Uncharacterized protein n=1 Tax=Azospirillum argentinense TaxID=2970906 RepID=A0A060DCA8_9PROT|nr:hypothetical protein [Azospirillum argentinense]AIB11791.1 hypothetical protein ABAZ39_07215 [Azospirillum argentinense]EZQ09761.1 hypothetical protein ABAZ39_08635 [Azospirillum argentinense]